MADSPSPRLPNFFVIGAMKCGTSTLHEQLAKRSGLFMCEPKEPNFFSNDEQVRHGINEYAKLFAPASASQLCGESSTHYTKLPTYPNTVVNIAQHVDDARFVYVIRDPMVRMASQYLHEWTQREVRGSYAHAVRQHERYVAYSSYARQLEPYIATFGAERVLVVFFERLVAEPNEELARVCRFIGDPSPEPVVWDDRDGQKNVSRERMRKSKVREWVLGVPALRSLKDSIPQSVRERIKDVWRLRSRPQLDEATADWARSQVDEDLKRLGRWLGRELTCANFAAQAASAQAQWVNPPERESPGASTREAMR